MGDDNRPLPAGKLQRAALTALEQGPKLIVNRDTGHFVLVERGSRRMVAPLWIDDELHIGCTTITREAFERLREFLP
jgi:hypothetical protein